MPTNRRRWQHDATKVDVDLLSEHQIAVLHLHTTDEADHSFRVSLPTLERLRSEIDAVLPRRKLGAAPQ